MASQLIPGIVVTLIFVCLVVPASWRIAAKAGYNPTISLLTFISPINLILLLVFALREWPIERRLRMLEERLKSADS
jgi:hypothetical protein